MEENRFFTLWFDIPLLEEEPPWIHKLDISEKYNIITFTNKKYIHKSIKTVEVFPDVGFVCIVIKSAYDKRMKEKIRKNEFGKFLETGAYYIFFVSDAKFLDKGRNKKKFFKVVEVKCRDDFTKDVIKRI